MPDRPSAQRPPSQPGESRGKPAGVAAMLSGDNPTPPPADIIVEAASVLHAHGHTTSATMRAVARLNEILGTRYKVDITWTLVVLFTPEGETVRTHAAMPSTVHMGRVAPLVSTIFADKPPTAEQLWSAVTSARTVPLRPTWLFALAAGLGAVCLALIFGSQRPGALALIFVAAAVGAVTRRLLAGHTTFVTQTLAAALIAGIAGSLSVYLDLTSAARLVAVCPAMVLVPGPALVNACLDFADRRHRLGMARLCDASVTILMICLGLLVGLFLGGTTLPVTAPGVSVPWWLDVAAAGLVACCFPVFFSMPHRSIGWAALAGAIGHGARWLCIAGLGWSIPASALVDCLLVAAILAPVCFHKHLPFAGVGFAAVVALVPGVFLFRAFSGIFQIAAGDTSLVTLGATAQDAASALLIILAMAIGIALPHEFWLRRMHRDRKI